MQRFYRGSIININGTLRSPNAYTSSSIIISVVIANFMINSSELLSAGRANISKGEISVGLCNVEASVLINFVTCFVLDKFSNRNSAQANQVIWDPPKKISRNICQRRKETEIITIFVFA